MVLPNLHRPTRTVLHHVRRRTATGSHLWIASPPRRATCHAAAPHARLASLRSAAAASTYWSGSSSSDAGIAPSSRGAAAAAALALGLLAGVGTTKGVALAEADAHDLNPASMGREDIGDDADRVDDLPVHAMEEVSKNDGQNGRPIWMTYGGIIYDVTNFIPNHPGGSEKILMAAGGAIEPHWHLYRQHFSSDLPMRLMEKMIVGRLDEKDQEEIEEAMELMAESDDPYGREPKRHPALRVHSDAPMDAEVPSQLLTDNYLTPTELFYIRHHHPVPYLSEDDIEKHRLKVDSGRGEVEMSLDDLKKLEKVEVVATIQCSGNRRGDFEEVARTSGTSWGQGAISTAKWGGARLTDVLAKAGLDDSSSAEKAGLEHIRLEALDGMVASIGIEKGLNPFGDCIVAYEMNGESLSRDHGFPVRLIVPGYSAVRSVKWLSKIELAETEAEGPWQRGLNYKMLPPSVTDATLVDLDKMPSMTEASVFSGITSVEKCEIAGEKTNPTPGEVVMIRVGGWAWAGGGRNIVRVDITGDGGKTWECADIYEGENQKFGRAWAWVFWSCVLPAIVRSDGTVEVCSKAVDLAFNVQPEKSNDLWNVRGLGNSSWFRSTAKVC